MDVKKCTNQYESRQHSEIEQRRMQWENKEIDKIGEEWRKGYIWLENTEMSITGNQ